MRYDHRRCHPCLLLEQEFFPVSFVGGYHSSGFRNGQPYYYNIDRQSRFRLLGRISKLNVFTGDDRECHKRRHGRRRRE